MTNIIDTAASTSSPLPMDAVPYQPGEKGI
jgi:hypothetical protein